MAQQRVIMADKAIERVINDMFTELYVKTNFLNALKTFKIDYNAATTTDDKLKVVAQFLKLI